MTCHSCHGPLMVVERWTPETCCGPSVELVTVCPRCLSPTVGSGTTNTPEADAFPESVVING